MILFLYCTIIAEMCYMPKIIFVSGACGSGKTTFADAYARYLVQHDRKTLYVIHGDNYHRGFIEPEEKGDFFVDGQASNRFLWNDILRFNWDCIITTAQRALKDHLDIIIDYVIEDEFDRVRELAKTNHVPLYYIVLTADADELESRLRNRGDVDLIFRALFLKKKLEAMPENQGHIYDNTEKRTEEVIREIMLEEYLVQS